MPKLDRVNIELLRAEPQRASLLMYDHQQDAKRTRGIRNVTRKHSRQYIGEYEQRYLDGLITAVELKFYILQHLNDLSVEEVLEVVG